MRNTKGRGRGTYIYEAQIKEWNQKKFVFRC